jgi:polyhydroxybutyrate depolymerase
MHHGGGVTRVGRRFSILTALIVIALTVAGCAGGDRSSAHGTEPRTLDVQGTTREYRVHVPDRLASDTALVVFLHGGFGSAAQAESAYGWDELADREGFVVAYPQGDGVAWNAGDCCGAPARKGIDDVAFISAVTAELQTEFGIAPSRTFAAGMSNGAMMVYRMACDTTVFAAIASVAGTIVTSCDDPAPVSVLEIHGLDDERVRYDGDPGSGATRVDGMPIDGVIALWRETDTCQDQVDTAEPPVTTIRSECADDRVVELITIAGAGHQWPGASAEGLADPDPASPALDATETVWEFFDEG